MARDDTAGVQRCRLGPFLGQRKMSIPLGALGCVGLGAASKEWE